MNRGLLLTLAALCVVGSGVGFAFTPSVGQLPDVIIGDQTPLDNLTPGDITTSTQTLEGTAATANIFSFPNAFNVFDLVDDNPQNVTGFTSDANLVYKFIASPVTPETGVGGAASNNRISINGTTISASTQTTVALTAATASLDFTDVEYSGDADPLRTVGTLTYRFGVGFHPSNQTNPAVQITRNVVDINGMTLTVTNLQGRSASDSFLVYTVNDGPDATSGGASRQIADLSAWTLDASGRTPQLGGIAPQYPGDTSATGSTQGDDDVDSSVSDLDLNIPGTAGQSFMNYSSPLDIIPFTSADATYRLQWTVTRGPGFTNDGALPAVRFRYGYGAFGDLGQGLVNGNGFTAPPTTTGRNYNFVFDALNVASANASVQTGSFGFRENGLKLFFETVDFDATVGGGFVELDNLEIASLNRANILANGTVVANATDFSTNTSAPGSVGVSGAFTTTQSGGITVTRTTSNATITSPFNGGNSTFTDNFGFSLTLNVNGIGFFPVTAPATNGKFYRAAYTFDASANTSATPLPQIVLQVATFNPGQRFTTQINITARRSAFLGSPAPANPALSASTSLAAYLAIPEGLNVEPTTTGPAPVGTAAFGLGDQIACNITLQDSENNAGGSIIVSGMSISSYPETLLP